MWWCEWTALMVGNVRAAVLLLAAGADPNARSSLLDGVANKSTIFGRTSLNGGCERRGLTPLEVCCVMADGDVGGAEETPDCGERRRMSAEAGRASGASGAPREEPRLAIARLLLAHGADPRQEHVQSHATLNPP